MHQTERSFDVPELTRMEGLGALDVTVRGDEIIDLAFRIFEPPRFYEAFLRGRMYLEVTDITSRICGICPVAYQTSAANAVEQILGIEVSPEIRNLRRLLYLAEWIESHGLHVYMLHAPDFLGYPSGIDLAREHPDVVRRGLRLKKLGNTLMALIGGREVHPVNPRLGGFWRAPEAGTLRSLTGEVEWALQAALETVTWVSSFPFPEVDADYEFVALHDPGEYAIVDGRILSNRGIDAAVEEWPAVFREEQVARSNALHARVRERGSYLAGPLARFNLNFSQLHPVARRAAVQARATPPLTNPYRSIVVRAVEMVHAAATVLELLDRYRPPSPPFVTAPVRAGTGHGASEAPRGLLYHRFAIDDRGLITDASIVPPTSQIQLRVEEDLRTLLPGLLHLEDDRIRQELEKAVRNYDPCISCATHFIDLRLRRT